MYRPNKHVHLMRFLQCILLERDRVIFSSSHNSTNEELPLRSQIIISLLGKIPDNLYTHPVHLYFMVSPLFSVSILLLITEASSWASSLRNFLQCLKIFHIVQANDGSMHGAIGCENVKSE